MAITGKDAKKAAQDVAIVKGRCPDVTQILGHVFPGSKTRMSRMLRRPALSRKRTAKVGTQFVLPSP